MISQILNTYTHWIRSAPPRSYSTSLSHFFFNAHSHPLKILSTSLRLLRLLLFSVSSSSPLKLWLPTSYPLSLSSPLLSRPNLFFSPSVALWSWRGGGGDTTHLLSSPLSTWPHLLSLGGGLAVVSPGLMARWCGGGAVGPDLLRSGAQTQFFL